jgi:hypothetical protein
MAFFKFTRLRNRGDPRAFYVCGLLALLFLLLPVALYGQVGKATISGTVTDQSGAVVPGATITAKDTLTGVNTTVTAASNGVYVIPLLPTGNYSLTVEHPGFQSQTRAGIILQAEQVATVDISLTIGAVTQRVEVSANAQMVETATNSLEQVVGERSIVELPLLGRNPAGLVFLNAGTVNVLATAAGRNQTFVADPNDTGGATNGGRQGSTYYMLDGANHMDNENNLAAPMPNPDATQEFQMIQNNFGAQYGFAPSAVVSIVTRSGTNQWHGDAFEFLRNYALNAANWFTGIKDTLKRNQYGGSVGGPIKKDKWFIFGNYQRTSENSLTSGVSDITPTAAEMKGDFSDVYTGVTANACGAGGPANLNFDTGQIYQPNAAAPFGSPVVCPAGSALAGQTVSVKIPYVGNQIDPMTYNPISLHVQQSIPIGAPQGSALGTGFVYLPSVLNADVTNEFTVRTDYNPTEKDRITGRVFFQKYHLVPSSGDGDFLASIRTWDVTYANYNGSYVRTIRPNLVNNFVGTVNYTHSSSYPDLVGKDGQPVSLQLYGSNVSYPPYAEYPPGIDQWLTEGYDFGENTNTPMFRRLIVFSDSLTWTKSKHMIVTGIDVLHENYTDSTDWQASPRVWFDGEVTGSDRADMLLGMMSQFEQGGGEYTQNYMTNWNPYIQDTYRAKSNFTINLGLRWEPWMPPSYRGDRTVSFRPGQQSTRYPNAPPGLVFPGDSGVNSSANNPDYRNFSPRVGFAWQPHALPNTSIRAAFGIFMEPIDNTNYHWMGNTWPFSGVTDLYYDLLGLINVTNPYANFPANNNTSPYPPFATLGTIPPPTKAWIPGGTIVQSNDPRLNMARDQTWNFSIQHQFGGNNMLQVAYVGSETYHLFVPVQLNPGYYSAHGARLNYPAFGSILEETPYSTASYNGLQISYQKRFSHGLQFTSNYTYSKCLDNLGMADASASGDLQDPFNWASTRGLCDVNFPHVWVSNWVWQSPSLKSLGRAESTILGSWQFSGIYTIQSGEPFSVLGGCNGGNNSLSFVTYDRADLTGKPFDVRQGSKANWISSYFNPAAFQCNAPGTFGDSARNLMAGPGTNNADIGFSKNFPFKERYRVQFRWEMFNAFNRAAFGLPGNNPTLSNFGRITGLAASTGGLGTAVNAIGYMRIMQAALKFYF